MLANFAAEVIRSLDQVEFDLMDSKWNEWVLMNDGSATSKGSGMGFVLVSQEDQLLNQGIVLSFSATNNEVEYESLIMSLLIARRVGVNWPYVKCDSQLVAHQITKGYGAKNSKLHSYLG